MIAQLFRNQFDEIRPHPHTTSHPPSHLAQTQTTDTNKPNYSLFPSQSRPFTGDFAGPQSQSSALSLSIFTFFFLALFSQLHPKHTDTHRVTIECCQIFAPLNNIKSKTRLTICHSINLNGFCPSPAGDSSRFFLFTRTSASLHCPRAMRSFFCFAKEEFSRKLKKSLQQKKCTRKLNC